ncbi:hypothetical protein [Prevotella falsenii]|uniref:hypothetical protein n=1 Tax=Prevotella falsenii TaxID=515414 RepID=UPI0004693DB5|nr:hypothetical protein [Prevotella falsenii]
MDILKNQAILNGKDIWTEYHVFLREEKAGEQKNLEALLTPAKMKAHVAVDFREEDGEKYSARLLPKSEARDIKLHFAIVADNKVQFLQRYRRFVQVLKTGNDGWLVWNFPPLALEIRTFVTEFTPFDALTNLWVEEAHCGAFHAVFREPNPTF